MSNNRKDKKGSEENVFIKNPRQFSKTINPKDIETLSEIDYPLFSFKYLQEHSIKECRNSKFFFDYLMRMKKLSELGWKNIEIADRHGFGMEKISRKIIKPDIPNFITPEVPIFAFRANGNNLPFLGVRCGKIFYVIFIETDFGDIYDHD